MKEQTVLVSIPVIFKREDSGPKWFIVRQRDDDGWELPKVVVRKVESSVRASIRAMSEQGGMRAQVYEEIGRTGGATKVNGQAVTQKNIYYLLMHKGGANEVLEFTQSEWLDYSKAVKKLESKNDQNMLKEANDLFKKLNKEGRFDKQDDDDKDLVDEE